MLASRTSSTFDPGDVVEHQPRSCSQVPSGSVRFRQVPSGSVRFRQVPSSGVIPFSNIVIEVDYQRVETPLWVAKQC